MLIFFPLCHSFYEASVVVYIREMQRWLTEKVHMWFSVIAPRSNNKRSLTVALPPCFAKELEWGNWLGSGLFENMQAVARRSMKLSFPKLYLRN